MRRRLRHWLYARQLRADRFRGQQGIALDALRRVHSRSKADAMQRHPTARPPRSAP